MSNKVSEYYDDLIARQKKVGVNARHKSILKKMKALGLSKNSNILEVGCGIGTLSSLLIKYLSKTGSLTSIDISEKSIELAQKTYAKNKNVTFRVHDLTKMTIEGLFDFIILPDVLEHIPKEFHNNLFENLKKSLLPNGIILIHIPNPYMQSWYINNDPKVLQIIDEAIFISEIERNTIDYGLEIFYMQTYSIWLHEDDYQFIALRQKKIEDKITYKTYSPSIFKKAIDKIKLMLN